MYIGTIPTPAATESRQEWTATAGQTVFPSTGGTVGYADLFVNGVKMASSDFTFDGADFTLTTGAAAGDVVNAIMRQADNALVALPIKDSGGNNVLSEANNVVSIDSGVQFPAIGQLVFWHGYAAVSSSINFTLDGVSSYTIIFNGRRSTTPFHGHNLTFIIDSTDGTITSKTDAWGADMNESFNNSTKVLTLSTGSSTNVMSILIFKGAVTEGT